MIYKQGWRQTGKAVIEGIPGELLHMTQVFPMPAIVRNSLDSLFANTYPLAIESVFFGDGSSPAENESCIIDSQFIWKLANLKLY